MSIGTYIGHTGKLEKSVPDDQFIDPDAKVAYTLKVGEKREHKANRLDALRAVKVRPKGSKLPPMFKIITHKNKDGSTYEQKVLI